MQKAKVNGFLYVVFVLLLAPAVNAELLDDLVGFWSANDDINDNNAKYNLTIAGASINRTNVKVGNGSAHFLPSNTARAYSTKVISENGTSFTFAGWVNASVWDAGVNHIFGTTTAQDTNAVSCYADQFAGSIRLYCSGTGITQGFSTTNQWVHVVFIWSATSAKIYLDGVEAASGTTGNLNISNRYFVVGGLNGAATALNGQLDNFGLWARSLTTDEISTLYNNGDEYDPYNPLIKFTAEDGYTGASINSFTVNISNSSHSFQNSTASGTVTFSQNGTYTYILNASNYANSSGSVSSGAHKNVDMYSINSFNITFLDELTNEIITKKVYLELISDGFSANYTTHNGGLNITALSPATYTMRYYGDNYTTKFYIMDLADDAAILTFYMLNNSLDSSLRIQVLNDLVIPLENAVVKVQRYDLTLNSYKTVDIQETGSQGTMISEVTAGSEYYKFIVEYNSEVRLITNPEYIDPSFTDSSDDVYILQISLVDTVMQTYADVFTIQYNLLFNTTSGNFKFLFNDVTNTVTEGCLTLYQVVNTYETFVNSTCAAGASSTILLPVYGVNGTSWRAKAYVTYSGDSYIIDSEDYKYPTTIDWGLLGVFATVLLTLVAVGVGIWSPMLAIILAPIPALLFSILGWLPLEPQYPIALVVLAIVIAYMFRRRA